MGHRSLGVSRRLTQWLRGSVLLLSVALLLTGRAEASNGPWSEPIPLTSDHGWAWFPDIATDIYGDVHVVWNTASQNLSLRPEPVISRNPSDDASWLTYTQWDGQHWSAPNDIAVTMPSSVALRSALTSDQTGHLLLFARGLNPASTSGGSVDDLRVSAADATMAGNVGAWSPGIPLNRSLPTYYPSIAVDSHGVIHAVWTEYDGQSSYGIYYSRSSDAGKTWSGRQALEPVQPVYWFRAQLTIGPRDDLNVVWEVVSRADALAWAASTTRFYLGRSVDGGESWQTTGFVPTENPSSGLGHLGSLLEGPLAGSQQPAVGVDGQDQVLLVSRDRSSNLITFQRSADGRTWTPPTPLPGPVEGIARPFDRYSMATDSAGHVHLVAVGYLAGSKTLSLVHSEWDGERWSPPDVVDNAPPYPEYPRIAVAEGNRLHVVWFDGDAVEVSRTPIGIRYSTMETTAPFVPPAPRPIEQPRPMASVQAAAPSVAPAIAPPEAQRHPFLSQPVGNTAILAGDLQDNSIREIATGLGVAAILVIAAYTLKHLHVVG